MNVIEKVYRPMKICSLVANDMTHDSRVDRQAETLGVNGHDVSVLCSQTSGTPSQEKKSYYSILRRTNLLATLIERRMHWKSIRVGTEDVIDGPANISILRSLVRIFLRVALSAAFDLTMIHGARKLDADIYICNDVYTLRIGAFMKILGKRILYDAHELYPDMFSDTPPYMRKILMEIERFLVKFADSVITVNEFIASIMASRYRIRPPTIVMNCPKAYLQSHLTGAKSKDQKVVLFHGALSRERGLENLVSACKYLRNDVRVVLRGKGSIEGKLRKLASGLDNCLFEEPVPVSEVVAKASEADVGIIIYLPITLNNMYASPNKLFEYLQAGLPVLGSDLPFLRKIIVENDVGFLFDPNNPQEIANAINRITQDETLKKLRQNIEKVKGKFTWENESEKLLKVVSGRR